jgi:hypothetical protein
VRYKGENYDEREEQGIVMHTCNLSTQEAEAGESQAWSQPELQSKTLPQKNQK